MQSINLSGTLLRSTVENFPGFLSCLVYSTAHENFRSLITDQWDMMHQFSGPILILVGDRPGDESGRAPAKRQTGAYTIEMMVTTSGFQSHQTNEINEQLRRYCNLRREDMPAITFFDGFAEPTTLSFSFRSEASARDHFLKMLDGCEVAWGACQGVGSSNLQKRRYEGMKLLLTQWGRSQFLRCVGGMRKLKSFSEGVNSLVAK